MLWCAPLSSSWTWECPRTGWGRRGRWPVETRPRPCVSGTAGCRNLQTQGLWRVPQLPGPGGIGHGSAVSPFSELKEPKEGGAGGHWGSSRLGAKRNFAAPGVARLCMPDVLQNILCELRSAGEYSSPASKCITSSDLSLNPSDTSLGVDSSNFPLNRVSLLSRKVRANVLVNRRLAVQGPFASPKPCLRRRFDPGWMSVEPCRTIRKSGRLTWMTGSRLGAKRNFAAPGVARLCMPDVLQNILCELRSAGEYSSPASKCITSSDLSLNRSDTSLGVDSSNFPLNRVSLLSRKVRADVLVNRRLAVQGPFASPKPCLRRRFDPGWMSVEPCRTIRKSGRLTWMTRGLFILWACCLMSRKRATSVPPPPLWLV